MLNNDFLNTIVLVALLALVGGMGLFITQKKQPAELERLEQEEMTLRLRQAEVNDLLVEQAGSREMAEDAIRRWNARYKVLPQHLSSPSVVSYLNQLSRDGFQTFDVTLGGVARRSGFSTLSYEIRGTGFFETVYRFIWEVENGRGLYRISDVNVREVSHDEPNAVSGVPRRLQLVQFSMTLEAYFGGMDGMSAPDSLISVPDHVLPSREPAGNPFFPLVLAQLPPNTDGLVDLENDELISVLGDVAVFRTSTDSRQVREGERVYLGRLTSVDAKRARVVADLNKGGIRERLEIELATGERYREAMGRVQLIPLTSQRPARPAPPQPGTPEYIRLYGNEPLPAADPVEVTTRDPMREIPGEQARSDDASGVTQPDRGVAIRPFPAPRQAPHENQ